MSCFVCSDLHILTVALFASEAMGANPWTVANELKRENIKSYNARYNQKVRFTKFKVEQFNEENASLIKRLPYNDTAMLASSLEYQSCEHTGFYGSAGQTFLNMITKYAQSKADSNGQSKSHCWSI